MKDLEKQAEEILAKMRSEMPFPLSDNVEPYILEAMNIHARRVANVKLEEAAEKVQMKIHDGHFKTDSPTKHVQIGANNVQIDKDSILSLKITE